MSGRIQIPKLSQAAADAFDRYTKASAAKKRADAKSKKEDERRKVDLEKVIEEMGTATLGMLPDGRVVHRTKESRDLPALTAKTITWDRLTEAILG